MPRFRCEECGHYYVDTHNFTSCPNCSGLGKPDPQCTCINFRNSYGALMNLRAVVDKDCPIHGTNKPAQ